MILLACDPAKRQPAFAVFATPETGGAPRLIAAWRNNIMATKPERRQRWFNEHVKTLFRIARGRDPQKLYFACEGQYIAKDKYKTKAAQSAAESILTLTRMHGILQAACILAGWKYVDAGIPPKEWMPAMTGLPLAAGTDTIRERSVLIADAIAKQDMPKHWENTLEKHKKDHNIAAAICIGAYTFPRMLEIKWI